MDKNFNFQLFCLCFKKTIIYINIQVSNGNISECVVHEFIKPFVTYLMTTDDERQMKHIMKHVFRYLIFQSDVGLDYMEKFKAWRKVSNKNIKLYSNI